MERTFNQKVIELAYPQVAIIAIQRNISLKSAQEQAVRDQLELMLKNGHNEARYYLLPFLLAAARQILNPVSEITDEHRKQLNDHIKHELDEDSELYSKLLNHQ